MCAIWWYVQWLISSHNISFRHRILLLPWSIYLFFLKVINCQYAKLSTFVSNLATKVMAAKDETNAEPVRVALWCVPRSTSTIFSKCLCGVEDIIVFSELYTYAASCRSIFAATTGQDIPAELDGNDKLYEEANALWEKTTGSRISTERLS